MLLLSTFVRRRNLVALLTGFFLSLGAFAQPGSLDVSFTSFVSGFTPTNGFTRVQALPDGKVLAAGGSEGLYRLNTDGSIDNSFNPGGAGAIGEVNRIVLLAGGKILIGGFFSKYNGTDRPGFARLNADGTLDGTFNPVDAGGIPLFPQPVTFAAQPDGKVIVITGADVTTTLRLNPNGSLDGTFTQGQAFNGGNNATVTGVYLQSSNKIILVGDGGSQGTGTYTIGANSFPFRGVIRLNTNGTVDNTFTQLPSDISPPGGAAVSNNAVIQPDDKILVLVNTPVTFGAATYNILRLNPGGTVDNTFNNGTGFGALPFYGILLQADGKVVALGDFASYRGSPRNGIVRINPDGSLDGSFNPGTGFPSGTPYSITRLPGAADKYVVAGRFSAYNGISRLSLVRINGDGSNDGTFANFSYGFDAPVSSLLVQPDGKVVTGGFFNSFNSTSRKNIARLNTDGTNDNTFNPGTGFDQQVNAVARQADGKLWVGGNFTTFNTTNTRSGLVRLKDDGSWDGLAGVGTDFNPVFSIAIRPTDGRVFVGGFFTTYNGATVKPLIMINQTSGVRDAAFTLPASVQDNFQINTIAVQGDNKVVAGGTGLTTDPTFANVPNIYRFNTNGTVDGGFSVGSGFNNGNVNTIAILPGGNILVGGGFTEYKGTPRNNLALLDAATGNLLPAFAAGVDGEVKSIFVHSDGKILVGGNFTTPTPFFARFNPDGTVDGTFTTGGGPNGSIYSIAQQTDGKIIIGGAFSQYGTTPRDYIARVNNAATCGIFSFTPTGTNIAATAGVAFSVTIAASGGTAPYTYAISAGTLPAGVTLTTAGVLAGTPTAAGSSTFTIRATATGGCTGDKSYTLTIAPGCPTITLSPATLPSGTVGTAYTQTFTASGGATAFTVSSGTLPAGLTLSAAGMLSGTPTTAGSSSVVITATAGTCTGTRSYTLLINPAACLAITILPATLSGASVGTAYTQTFTASGGTAPYTYSLASGTLPAGLSLSASGNVTGTPTAAGSSTFTIRATAGTCSGTQNYTFTVGNGACPTVSFTPASLPDATVGTAYSQTIVASGGTLTYALALATGSTLPAGLTLNPATGVISGTPTATGNSTFTIQATSGTCTGSQTYTLTAGTFTCPTDFAVAVGNLPPAVIGTPYTGNFTATGGTAPYTYSLASGTLPAGLSLSASGNVTGTPATAGTSTFTIRATDGKGCTATREITLVSGVGCAVANLTVNPATLPALSTGGTYSQNLTGAGGTAPYTFVVSTGVLPAGLSLNLTTGVLSGSTTVTGGSTFTVQITDANGCTGTRDYSLCVNPQPKVTASNRNSYSIFTLLSDSPDGNQWLKDGQLIQGATGATLEVKDKGSYQVRVTANGCSGTSEPFAVTAAEPGIVTFLTLYPNPADGELYIQYRSATGKPVQFVSVNVLGVVMGRITPVRNSEGVWEGKLPTDSYPAGAYLLRVEEEGTRQVKHFVKR
jgi:uncharacterized delta-60 repeat protein